MNTQCAGHHASSCSTTWRTWWVLWAVVSWLGSFSLPATGATSAIPAIPVVVINTETTRIPLTAQAHLEWNSVDTSAGHAVSPELPAVQTDGALSLGFTRHTVAATVDLLNPTNQHIKRILVFEAPWLDQLDVTLLTPDGERQTTLTGDILPFSSRALSDRRPNAMLQLSPGVNRLQVRVTSADPLLFRMVLMSREGLALEQALDGWTYGALYAALVALLLFTQSMAGSLGGGIFSGYSLYLGTFLLAHATYNGYSYQWLWPQWPLWGNWAHALLIGGWALFALLFANRFLNLAQRSPSWHRVFRWLTWAGLAGFVLAGALRGYSGALAISIGICSVMPFVMLVSGWIQLVNGHRDTRYFLYATTCGAVGTVVTVTTVIGWLPYTDWGYHAAEAGMLMDALLLSLAMASRVRVVAQSAQTADALRLDQANRHAEHLEQQVSERTKAHQAINADLQAALSALQQRDRLRTRFFAAASHDLRQPLHAVRLLVEAVQRAPNVTIIKTHTQALDTATTHLSQLVESLLDISRLDAGAVTPKSTKFPLEQVASEIESTLSPVAQAKHLKLRYAYPWQPLTLWVDRQLFMSVVLNLVGNALKYTDDGGVLVGFRKRNEGLLLQIFDTGCGFSNENKERIFEEFQQLNNPTQDRSRGLGLGLAIAKRTCSLLGLALDCHSQPGKGSVFEVRIPAECVLINDFDASDRMSSEPLPVQTDRWMGSTILVVDDDPLPLHALAEALNAYGVTVLACVSANDAMNHPQLSQVDALVADENLQNGLSGSYLLDVLVRTIGRELPGVVVTGNTDPEAVLKISARGWPVLFKPTRALEVLQTLSALHSAHQRRFTH